MSFRGIFRKAGITIDGNTLTLRRDRDGVINKTSSAITGTIRGGEVTLNMTAAASANIVEALKVQIVSDVKTGAWANALVGSIDYSGGGSAHGMAAAVACEMIPPNSSLERGSLYALDVVFGCGANSSWGSAGPVAFMRFENWGTKDYFSANAFLFHLMSETPAVGGLLSENSRTLRVRIGDTSKYIYLSDTEDDLGAFVVDSADFASAVAIGVTLSGAMTTGIYFSNTVEKGIDFTDATLTQGWNNAFIRCGSGDGAGANQHTVDVTDHYIPLQINIASTLGPTSPREVCAAMFRVDAITADQGNSSCDVLALRAKIDKNVYAATCINASIEISDHISVPTATVQGIFVQMTGVGTITSPNDVNVLEVKYAQTSGGGGCNNVAQFYMIGTACTIDNIVDIAQGAGTVTNGLLIRGAMTTAINITSTCTTGISISGTLATTTSRAINSSVSISGPAHGDGYAANEFQLNQTGTNGDSFSAVGAWINIGVVTMATGGEKVSALNTGIFSEGATLTDAHLIFGMRMQAQIDSGGFDRLCPFSLNTGFTVITALFDCGAGAEVSYAAGAGGMSTQLGSIPFMVDVAGTIYYIKLYDTVAA